LNEEAWEKLNEVDRKTLSKPALFMIYESASTRGTIRSEGNIVAHDDTQWDVRLAISEAKLTETQRGLMEEIYRFVDLFDPSLC
jgi:hypothetical protein